MATPTSQNCGVDAQMDAVSDTSWGFREWVLLLRDPDLETKEVHVSTQGQYLDSNAITQIKECLDEKISTFSKKVIVILDLSLENSSLSDGPFVDLILYLSSKCPLFHLRRLKVFKNNLTDVSISLLSKFLQWRHPYPVHEIHLSHNWIKDHGAKNLLLALKDAKYPGAGASSFNIYPRKSFTSSVKVKNDKRTSVPVWIRWERNCIENPTKVCNEAAENYRGSFMCSAPYRLERHKHPKHPYCSPTQCVQSKNKGDVLVHLHMYSEQNFNKNKINPVNAAKSTAFAINRCTIDVKASPKDIYLKRGCHPFARLKEITESILEWPEPKYPEKSEGVEPVKDYWDNSIDEANTGQFELNTSLCNIKKTDTLNTINTCRSSNALEPQGIVDPVHQHYAHTIQHGSPVLSDTNLDQISPNPQSVMYGSLYMDSCASAPNPDPISAYSNIGMNNFSPNNRGMNLPQRLYKVPFLEQDSKFRMNKSFDQPLGYGGDPHIFLPKSLVSRCVAAYERLLHCVKPLDGKVVRESRQILDTLHWHLHNSPYHAQPQMDLSLGLENYMSSMSQYFEPQEEMKR